MARWVCVAVVVVYFCTTFTGGCVQQTITHKNIMKASTLVSFLLLYFMGHKKFNYSSGWHALLWFLFKRSYGVCCGTLGTARSSNKAHKKTAKITTKFNHLGVALQTSEIKMLILKLAVLNLSSFDRIMQKSLA